MLRTKWFLSLLLVICSATSAQEPRVAPEVTTHRPAEGFYLFDTVVASGLHVSHAVYRKEPLGNDWWLQIRRSSGVSLNSREGGVVPTLSDEELLELVQKLLVVIDKQHGGAINSVQLDVTLTESLWTDVKDHLYRAAVPATHDPSMSPLLLSVARDALAGTRIVRGICEQAINVGKRCNAKPVSMNEVAFKPTTRGMRWGELKALSELGIQRETMWFSIDFER